MQNILITITCVMTAIISSARLSAKDPQDANPTAKQDLAIGAGPFQPTMESLERYECPEWFRDAKFGIWAHWGPQAVPMAARGIY